MRRRLRLESVSAITLVAIAAVAGERAAAAAWRVRSPLHTEIAFPSGRFIDARRAVAAERGR